MTESYDPERVQQFRSNLDLYNTQELRAIWMENERQDWEPEAFEAIRSILLERLGSLPEQRVLYPNAALTPKIRLRAFNFISIRGEFEFPSLSKPQANHILARILAALAPYPGNSLARSGKKLVCHTSWLQNRWKNFPAESGEIEAQPGTPGVLKYKFSLARSLKLWFIFSAILGIVVIGQGFNPTAIPVIILITGCIVGITNLYNAWWLENFIWKAIHN